MSKQRPASESIMPNSKISSCYDDHLVFQRREAGMYDVKIESGSGLVRIGLVSGKPGNWLAELPDGRSLTKFQSRKQAGIELAKAWVRTT